VNLLTCVNCGGEENLRELYDSYLVCRECENPLLDDMDEIPYAPI
jgi:hypothetical protein